MGTRFDGRSSAWVFACSGRLILSIAGTLTFFFADLLISIHSTIQRLTCLCFFTCYDSSTIRCLYILAHQIHSFESFPFLDWFLMYLHLLAYLCLEVQSISDSGQLVFIKESIHLTHSVPSLGRLASDIIFGHALRGHIN